jgi:hypothetical protein
MAKTFDTIMKAVVWPNQFIENFENNLHINTSATPNVLNWKPNKSNVGKYSKRCQTQVHKFLNIKLA